MVSAAGLMMGSGWRCCPSPEHRRITGRGSVLNKRPGFDNSTIAWGVRNEMTGKTLVLLFTHSVILGRRLSCLRTLVSPPVKWGHELTFMSVFIQRICTEHPLSARRVLGAPDAAVSDGRMEPAPSAFSELVFGGPQAYGGWGGVWGIWRHNCMWRCIQRMLPEAWKPHLAVEGYFNNIKAPEWFHFSILREMELCVHVSVCKCVKEREKQGRRGEVG